MEGSDTAAYGLISIRSQHDAVIAPTGDLFTHRRSQWGKDMFSLRDFLYGLPNRCYLEFVRHFILPSDRDEQISSTLDPLVIDLPAELVDKTYIVRQSVMDELLHPATWLILGKTGIGKTTIWAKLLSQTDESVLTVGLDYLQGEGSFFENDILSGKLSLLAPTLLIPRIFETYWEKTVLSVQRRTKYLPRLRTDKKWMELLRWFYRRYPPTHPPLDDYELMTWLAAPVQTEPLRDQLPAFVSLEELLRLITWSFSWKPFDGQEEHLQVYTNALVLLDGTRQLSAPAIRRLVEDAQSLYEMRLEGLQLKLLIDNAWESQVVEMDCVRQGRAKVYHLPRWSEQDLRKLLRRRILSFQVGGTTADLEEMPEYDLGKLLADSGTVRAEVGNNLESLIVRGAQGIPAHALCLARCIVAACAGCWPEEFTAPLIAYDVQRLIDLYQKHTRPANTLPDLLSPQQEE